MRSEAWSLPDKGEDGCLEPLAGILGIKSKLDNLDLDQLCLQKFFRARNRIAWQKHSVAKGKSSIRSYPVGIYTNLGGIPYDIWRSILSTIRGRDTRMVASSPLTCRFLAGAHLDKVLAGGKPHCRSPSLDVLVAESRWTYLASPCIGGLA
jgi:hypothetical protein